MPSWLMRLVWKVRGKRMVRVHCEDRPGTPVSTFEGILVGRWGGHYVLLSSKIVNGEADPVQLAGTVEIPAERVVFVQVIG